MADHLNPTLTTIAMAIVNVIGTVMLRISDGPHKEQYFAAGIVAYIIAAAIYVNLLKHSSLAVLAVASSTLQLGFMVCLSVWFFDEKTSLLQISAITIAIAGAAIALLVPVE